MVVDDKGEQEVENAYKKKLFDNIATIISSQSELFNKTRALRKDIGLDMNLPNIGTTLNNKLVLLQHEFEVAGTSMYSEKLGKVDMTLIGEAVTMDLIQYATNGIKNSETYQKIANAITENRMNKVNSLQQKNSIRQFLDKIKSFFVSQKKNDLLYEQQQEQAIKECISDYKVADEQLWEYNLRDNIISSITKQIRRQEYRAHQVPQLLKESVLPDLQKLGLADLIPELQTTLIEEYKKDLPDPKIYQIRKEDMYLYVPDFNRETKQDNKTSIEELHKQVQGILRDLSSIDEEIGALDRQEIAIKIARKQGEKVENNDEKVVTPKEEEEQKKGDISL